MYYVPIKITDLTSVDNVPIVTPRTENPKNLPITKESITRKIMKYFIPWYKNFAYAECHFLGITRPRILEPSKGGKGSRLKTPSKILKSKTAKTNEYKVSGIVRYFNGIASKTAVRKFDMGPAKDVIALPRTGSRKFRGSTGTGLPQPIPIIKSISVPMMSKCASGFKVILPRKRAVGSPR